MAESVDALVSNTSGATRAGSTPALGTCEEKDGCLSPFSFPLPRNLLVSWKIRSSTLLYYVVR